MKITAENVLGEQGWLSQHTVVIEQGKITSIQPATNAELTNLNSGYLVPGYVDTQVNGGGGVLLNQAPTAETLHVMSKAHLAFGTTSMLPTIVTDDSVVMANTADAVSDVLRAKHGAIVGVHFEGPFINKRKKGVHAEQFIRLPTDKELAILTRKDIGKVILTLAPEQVDIGLIRELVAEKVVLSIGHTNANYEQVNAALQAGASGFTHLYNAMSPLQSREPGAVGAALLANNAFAGLIVDHQHLHPGTARLAIQIKGPERIMLVTDSMAHVGSNLQRMAFFDTQIIRTGNKLSTPEGTLAGSCLDMHSAVLHTHKDLDIVLQDAIRMATQTPADFIGLGTEIGSITKDKVANLLLLDQDLALDKIWLHGQLVA